MEFNREVKTLIIGCGFSSVPLLRELDRTGDEYVIISEKIPNPIWANLKRNDRLDFDLVSSYNTSFYSFDQAKRFQEEGCATDCYPTAKEFYEMHLHYFEQYKERIVQDEVHNVDNYDGYSIVTTAGGDIYKATNVVVCTGFRRNIHNSLNQFDYTTTGKTLVFNTIGDSSNLMIAKLIARNNKIVILGNGFNALDKMFEINKTTVTLDQIEYHNIAFLFPSIYRAMISGNSIFPLVMLSLSFMHTKVGRFFNKLFLGLGKIISPNLFAFAYPETIRALKVNLGRMRKAMPFPNGVIAIKYWPVDGYHKFFGGKLEESIKSGYLLNDLPLFIDQGLVEYWSKTDIEVDHETKTITNRAKGKTLVYDHFIDGGPENPRLPKIVKHSGKMMDEYSYLYRENYLGVVPKKLSNIFFLGYTRPTTGGLANMTEMQGLLAHKLIHNESFKGEVYNSIEQRLETYNEKYYYTDEAARTDHLVFYGFYTEEVARAIGIDVKLSECKSISEVSKYLFFPNNAFKYRQKGEYKVEGCDKLVEHIDKTHQSWAGLKMRLMTFSMYHLMFFAAMLMFYLNDTIGLPALVVSTVLQYVFSFIFVTPAVQSQCFVQSPSYSYARFAFLLAGFALMLIKGPAWFFPVIGLDFLWSYVVRQINPENARLTFNDLKIKRKYKAFLGQYLEAYRMVHPVPNKK